MRCKGAVLLLLTSFPFQRFSTEEIIFKKPFQATKVAFATLRGHTTVWFHPTDAVSLSLHSNI
jgi:hypothetical protein